MSLTINVALVVELIYVVFCWGSIIRLIITLVTINVVNHYTHHCHCCEFLIVVARPPRKLGGCTPPPNFQGQWRDNRLQIFGKHVGKKGLLVDLAEWSSK